MTQEGRVAAWPPAYDLVLIQVRASYTARPSSDAWKRVFARCGVKPRTPITGDGAARLLSDVSAAHVVRGWDPNDIPLRVDAVWRAVASARCIPRDRLDGLMRGSPAALLRAALLVLEAEGTPEALARAAVWRLSEGAG